MPQISQVSLCAAIMKAVDRLGCKSINNRQQNVIVKAADLIVAAFEIEHKPTVAGMGWQAWLASDETGLSSRFMLRTMMPGCVPGERDGFQGIQYPHDPSDFGRCVQLLDAEPKLRDRLWMLTEHSGQWAALVGDWEHLEALYREELPSGKAPKLYARMQELLK